MTEPNGDKPVSRRECRLVHDNLKESVDAMKDQIAKLFAYHDESQRRAMARLWAVIIQAFGTIVMLALLVINLIK